MRRATSLASVLTMVVVTLGAVTAPAHAADPLTGRLVDAMGSGPVAGQTVRLRTVTEGGPGVVVDTDVTDAAGTFALHAGPSPDDEYYVQVAPGRFQGGFVGGAPKYVQPSVGYAMTYGAHAALGTIRANPAFIRGVVVDAKTKKPLRGIKVAARSMNDTWQTEGTDTTNRAGVFSITGLECEDDCYLKVSGAAKGYEVGYRACNGAVVATWGDACASPIGAIGKVRLEKD
ncbi:hypothetical protein ACFP8W_07735 [Nocardioides hankookensis]|uniref:Carboxypeptidase regulatory-like domain-containing protein n=1 Tax=Nocardioides hankookensis TaxID=443157 RepID=A0ABW1LNI3_9ACTN